MKNIFTILIIVFIILAGVVYKAQPELPVHDCTVKNSDLSSTCLSYITKFYDPNYLTYQGHTEAWIYRWSNKFGIKLGEKQTGYLLKYSSLEDAVNCHLTAAGDASLNMTLSPAEFEAAYEKLAWDSGIPGKLNTQF